MNMKRFDFLKGICAGVASLALPKISEGTEEEPVPGGSHYFSYNGYWVNNDLVDPKDVFVSHPMNYDEIVRYCANRLFSFYRAPTPVGAEYHHDILFADDDTGRHIFNIGIGDRMYDCDSSASEMESKLKYDISRTLATITKNFKQFA